MVAKMSLGSVNVKKISRNIFSKVLPAIIFNSFEWKSINRLSCASFVDQGYLSFIVIQKDITISLMTMETTNTGKNQKFNKKELEENVEAI